MSVSNSGSVTLTLDETGFGSVTEMFRGAAYGVGFAITYFIQKVDIPTPVHDSIAVSVSGYGGSDSGAFSGDGDFTLDASAAMGVEIGCEEWESEYGIDRALIDTRYGTARAFMDPFNDGAPENWIALGRAQYEKVTSVSASISAGGASASIGPITPPPSTSMDYTLYVESAGPGSITSTVSSTGLIHNYPGSHTETYLGASATISGSGFSKSSPASGPDVAAHWNVDAQLDVSLNGRLRAMGDAYAGPNLTLAWQNHLDGSGNFVYELATIGATFAPTYTYYSYEVSIAFNGTVVWQDSLHNQVPLTRLWITNPELAGSESDWQIGILGPVWDAMTLTHAAELPLTAGAWEKGPNTTDGVDGFHVVAGKAGSVAWVGTWNGQAYAWLRIDGGSTINKKRLVRVKINDKLYTFVADLTTDGPLINLCHPENLIEVDTQDWDIPYTEPGGPPQHEGATYGINRTDRVDFGPLPGEEEYDFDSLTLVRKDYARANFLGAYFGAPGTIDHQNWPELYPNIGEDTDTLQTYTFGKPFFWSDVDARRFTVYDWVMEIIRHNITGVPDSPSFQQLTISQFVGKLNEIPGITAALLPDANDALTSALACTYLMGGSGAVYHGGGWVEGLDMDMASTATVKGCLVVDEAGYYPGCGEWGQGASAAYGTVKLFCNKNVRSGAEGVSFPEGHGDPLAGQTVATERYSDHTGTGNGSTDAAGYFRSGQNHFLNINTYKVTLQVGKTPYRAGFVTGRPRWMNRVGFLFAPDVSPPGVANHQDWRGIFHKTECQSGNVVYKGFNSADPRNGVQFLSQVDDSADCETPRVFVDSQYVIWALYRRTGTGDSYVSYSTDRGQTWSEPQVAFSGGKYPTGDASKYGRILAAYVSGNIHGTYIGLDNVPHDFTFVDDSGTALHVADMSFGVSISKSGARIMTLSVVIYGETASSDWFSTDDGRTWRKVA